MSAVPSRSSTPPHHQGRRAGPGLRTRLAASTTLVGALVLLAGCAVDSSPPPSPSPAASSAPATTATGSAGASPTPASPTPAATAVPSASLPSQTDTSWGRIWDALPASFPRYPGAAPASVAHDPVSADFTVAADAATVVAGLRTALEAAGYSTVSQSGPLEDGSRTLESASSTAGCRVRTTVGPLGGLTHITVLYGSSCPFR